MKLWSPLRQRMPKARHGILSLGLVLASAPSLFGCSDDGEEDEKEDETATPAVLVEVVDGQTTEAGEQATVSVRLATSPSNDVSIDVSSSDETEGTVSPKTLTFTPDSWSAEQTIIVTGVDDDEADGDQEYELQFGKAESEDDGYDDLATEATLLTNIDDETASLRVSEAEGSTSEDGEETNFSVTLTAMPSAEVSVTVASQDSSEGIAMPDTLIFAPDNWDAPQNVLVKGVDDDDTDGDVTYTVDVSASSSDDPEFDGLEGGSVEITNLDNDSAGLVGIVSDGISSELGEQAIVEFSLRSAPSANVTVSFEISDESEAELATESLVFTPDNWAARQVVPVRGLDDDALDGNQEYQLQIADVSSEDATYEGLEPEPVSLLNLDDDSAGIRITTLDETSSEAGDTAQVEVVLLAEPSDDVRMDVFSRKTDEGRSLVDELVFTPDNWDAIQRVTVVGQDDDVADGDQTYALAFGAVMSGDSNYHGLGVADTELVNLDNETAAILANVTDKRSSENGDEASLQVWLGAKPTSDVTIPLTVTDATEAELRQSQLVFTPENFASRQTVRAVGKDDAIDDGNQTYHIAFGAAQSDDDAYRGIVRPRAEFINVDSGETAALVVAEAERTAVEEGESLAIEVVLASQPTNAVTVPVQSSRPGQAAISPSELTFTSANWNAPRAIVVEGIDDDVQDGDQQIELVFGPTESTDTKYHGLSAPDQTLRVIDNDAARVLVSALDATSSEDGKDAGFRIALSTRPTDPVTLNLGSSNPTEGVPSTSQLVFTSDNYAAPRLVSVAGQDDALDDGDQPYQVRFEPTESDDPNYDGITLTPLELNNRDNDTAALVVAIDDGRSFESGGDPALVSVRLASKPTAAVTLDATSSDASEAILETDSLVFTPENWNAPQQFVLLGQDDDVADGNQRYGLVFGEAVSDDADYAGMSTSTVMLTNVDDDSAGFMAEVVDSKSSESGGEATVELRLLSEPTSSVVVEFASSDTGEATASPAQVTFTAQNWNAPQAVTLIGQDDDVADGDQPYKLLWTVTSSDADYAALPTPPVALLNVDDDTAGVSLEIIDRTAGEDGSDAVVEVVLNSEPTGTVDISASFDSDELVLAESTLTFGPGDWETPQEFVFTGQNDAIADGNQLIEVDFEVDSSDPNYAALTIPSADLVNRDNDKAAIIMEALGDDSSTSESGDQLALTLVLTAEPTADVTLTLVSEDVGEGTLSTQTVTFNAANYNVPRSVTVNGVDDDLEDGDQPYAVRVSMVESDDDSYAGAARPSIELRNLDDD